MKIEIWSDIVCPFCYIGSTQFQKALDKFEYKDKVEVVYRSFQLRPETPSEPGELKAYEQLAKDKGQPVEAMKAGFTNIVESGKAEGLEMNMFETVMVNTFDGHKLIHFAAKHGKQTEAVKVMYETYFSETKNIASQDVLVEVADKLGLNVDEFKAALEDDKYSQLVKADIEKAASFGIQGVPAFIADEKIGTTGARGVESFSHFLDAAWKESNPIKMMDGEDSHVCKDENCTV